MKNLKLNYHMLRARNHEMDGLLAKLPFDNEVYKQKYGRN